MALDPCSAAREPAYTPALTGVRALAALWVTLFHLKEPLAMLLPWLAPLRPWIESGFLGVDFFFVLSGFVISHGFAHALGGPDGGSATLGFLRRRLARLYPLHLVIVLSLVAGSSAADVLGFERFAASPMWQAQALPAHLLLVNGWGLGTPAWNVPSWSASCELLGYLAFPALAPVLIGVRSRLLWLSVALLALGTHLGVVALHAGGSLDRTYEGGLLRFCLFFAAGCALWRARLMQRARDAALLSLCCSGTLIASLASGPSPLAVIALALAVPAIAHLEGPAARLLGSPLAQRWGQRSYALYLSHGTVVLLFTSLLPPERVLDQALPVRIAYLGVLLGAIAVVATAAHAWVERPIFRLLTRSAAHPAAVPSRATP